jgi:hypothetical protein
VAAGRAFPTCASIRGDDSPYGSCCSPVRDVAHCRRGRTEARGDTDALGRRTRVHIRLRLSRAGGTNPQPGVDPVTGQVHLYYVDHATSQSRVAVSNDGLTFPAGTPANGVFRNDARNTLLPDGSWRRDQWNIGTSQIGSLFSADGVTFTPEGGVRYTLQAGDKGTLGVYDAFSDRQGGVVLL